jgi:uncharacterized protein with HEPN domain
VPPRSWRIRIDDIVAAIETILQYTAGMDRAGFATDRRTVDAVVRNLIIIGEAAGHVPDDVVTAYPQIPWARMRGMRNLAVHEYFGVDADVLWDTVKGNLPEVLPELRRLLES